MMHIRTIRMVNFHNFVDETIDVERGGHLFLLGDNGSGKTTVLDAVHYVLSGGQLELNAAARVGGRAGEGRSIQGIVLRQDFERGVRSEGGAIAYAAVELVDEERGGVLSLGVGIEATTLEARVTRWGFVVPGPMEDVPLVVERDGARYPATREGLRAAIAADAGAGEVFYRIGDYRAAVAARLFGGPAHHGDACRFWSMAKAYREIVTGARDFGALFRQLLPAPDPKVFGEILRSLRGIADMQAALGELDGQRGYVADVMSLVAEVDAQRVTACRLRWLASHRQREDAAAELSRSGERAAALTQEVARLVRQGEAAEARSEAAEAALRVAEAQDTEGLSAKLREATGRQRELAGDVAERERDESRASSASHGASRTEQVARAALDELIDGARTGLGGALAAAGEAGTLPGSAALAKAMNAGGPADWAAARDSARAEASGRVSGLRRRLASATAECERAAVAQERGARELAALELVAEEQPRVEGFGAATAALAAAGIEAAPCYALCEPLEDADPVRLAWVESLAGDGALAAFVVAPADRDRAAELVAAAAPGVRVVVRTASDAHLPAWSATLFGAPEGDEERTALRALAAAIDQASSFGPVREADTRGLLEHRGAAFAPRAAHPRLLGKAARERAHAARVAHVREQLANAEAAARAALARRAAAEQRVHGAEALCVAIEVTGGAALTSAAGAACAASETATLRAEFAAEAGGGC